MTKKLEDMFTCFDRIHERDRRTDRQTLHDCIISCGKNEPRKPRSSHCMVLPVGEHSSMIPSSLAIYSKVL